MLIRNVAEHASSSIFFTAAAPGQWGDGHINCQPKTYWEALFLEYGWCPNEDLREKIVSCIREKPQIDQHIPWISRNLLIFTPSSERTAVLRATAESRQGSANFRGFRCTSSYELRARRNGYGAALHDVDARPATMSRRSVKVATNCRCDDWELLEKRAIVRSLESCGSRNQSL